MLNNIAKLNDVGAFPSSEAVVCGGRVELMLEHNTKWHANCRSGINKEKSERARVKHKSVPSHVKTCRMRLGAS